MRGGGVGRGAGKGGGRLLGCRGRARRTKVVPPEPRPSVGSSRQAREGRQRVRKVALAGQWAACAVQESEQEGSV